MLGEHRGGADLNPLVALTGEDIPTSRLRTVRSGKARAT
ncbi:hypothetical protein Rhow_009025 [Rhodococcus wratislaviensis]|uniref:Uncharacterized protein n=1 Tax=Rhodococcus wratislaviensis TaxID=44752 RepID=A0A402CM08_RHOWR|nr:hypothetical protein Rhow_009025 [Rhodococcus wratislaviensis]